MDKLYDTNDKALRKKYRTILLKEWGPDLARAAAVHQELTDSLPTTLSPIIDLLLKKENELAELRQFYIIGELPEFVFPESGSYRLELYIKPSSPSPGAEGIVINSISVLGRTDPSTCASCRERQAAGSHIRGYMALDPLVTLHLISQLDPSGLPWDAKKTPSEDDLSRTLSVLIHERLGMRLVKPDGTRLAVADADGSLGPVKLDKAKVPKVSLHSHVITFNHKKPSDHISFEEPESHRSYGTFQPNVEWKSFEASPLVYTSDVRHKAYIQNCSQV